MKERRLVAAEEYLNADEARLACDFLRASGIDAVVSADDCGGMEPPIRLLVAVKVLVREEDLERAKETLRADATQPSEGPDLQP